MRPIERGSCPQTDNEDIVFSTYDKAKPYLIDRIGGYCSFCEREAYSAALAIEHILPKGLLQYSLLIEDWNNFLLGCINCNSIKGINVHNEIYFPDKNNTFLAFQYKEGGIIEVNENLNDHQKIKAGNLIKLVGLDRKPGHPNYSKKDSRWMDRKTAWELAQRYKQRKLSGSIDDEPIIDLAKSTGFWSVWFTVFSDDISLKKLLIQEFKGTAMNCFQDTMPVKRISDQF